MSVSFRRCALGMLLAVALPVFGPTASMQQVAQRRPIEGADVIAWKTIGSPMLSNDGQWFACRLAPGEGDAQAAPDWMTKGVRRLKMEEHLKERGKPPTAPKTTTSQDPGK